MSNKTFEDVIKKISPSEREIKDIEKGISEFKKKIYPSLRGEKIFIGGSLAKKTLIKKETGYDIDFFVMFKESRRDVRSKRDISKELENILKALKIKYIVLKGSRNYFQVDFNGLRFELVPIMEIKKAGQAKNITDISPLHVKYLMKKEAKDKKIADEIKLAKAFCYACDCYGAESYIKGLSGYALEILTCYYGSFFNLIKNASKWTLKSKIIIDPEKFYKNKEKILEEMNKSKQEGPVILIDPVQKERNVCAALGKETLEKFITACKKFSKKPSKDAFFKKEFNPDILKNKAKNGAKFYELESISLKDKSDIAGAKLKKFYEFLIYSLKKENFKIISSYFDFNEKTLESKYFFVISEPNKDIIVQGPPISLDKKFQDAFRKKWKNFFVKKNRLYAKTKRKFSNFPDFLKQISREQMKEMGIKSVEIV
jgi:tRNA nucleotidyltransferase (CCA-adding enzyme)